MKLPKAHASGFKIYPLFKSKLPQYWSLSEVLLIRSRILYMVVSRLEVLFANENIPTEGDKLYGTLSQDNFTECHYLLQTLSKVLPALSHNGWVILLSHPVSPVEKPLDSSAQEGGFFMP
jgi:hypothetical protein